MKWVITFNHDLGDYHYYTTDNVDGFKQAWPLREVVFETSHIDDLSAEWKLYNKMNTDIYNKKYKKNKRSVPGTTLPSGIFKKKEPSDDIYSNNPCNIEDDYNEEYEEFMDGIRRMKSLDKAEEKIIKSSNSKGLNPRTFSKNYEDHLAWVNEHEYIEKR
jgi:hypothetical protein